jgi:hypothetical protein
LHRIEEAVAEEEYKYKGVTVVAQMREPKLAFAQRRVP